VALEGALKLKEISYIHAEGYPAAEMKHGPIAADRREHAVVFLAPKEGRCTPKSCRTCRSAGAAVVESSWSRARNGICGT